MIIGVTGGSGTGKTTALGAFAEMGAVIIDCDDLYHRLLETSGDMLDELRLRFSEAFDGEVFERKKLGGIVFNDPQALGDLNNITHGYVLREVKKAIGSLPEGGIMAIDAVALIESGLAELCDVVIGVIAPRNERVERIVRREGISEQYALSRVDSQKPDNFFVEGCDHILSNDGADLSAFYRKCKELFIKILEEEQNG